jgi:hypothetical protein
VSATATPLASRAVLTAVASTMNTLRMLPPL